MIATLSGTVKSISLNSAVIEVGGVGLLVNLSPRVAAALVVGTFTSMHTSLLVREDSLTLFGFENSATKELFELLQTVSGIGPKVAQSAVSVYEVPEIVSAIREDKLAILERIPGLGKKGAARLVLELKDKIGSLSFGVRSAMTQQHSWREQVEGALLNLGFTVRDSNEALDALAIEISDDPTLNQSDISGLLRRALQIRGKNK